MKCCPFHPSLEGNRSFRGLSTALPFPGISPFKMQFVCPPSCGRAARPPQSEGCRLDCRCRLSQHGSPRSRCDFNTEVGVPGFFSSLLGSQPSEALTSGFQGGFANKPARAVHLDQLSGQENRQKFVSGGGGELQRIHLLSLPWLTLTAKRVPRR